MRGKAVAAALAPAVLKYALQTVPRALFIFVAVTPVASSARVFFPPRNRSVWVG